MKKVVTIIGARPQFIKMALVSKALRVKNIKEIVVHTGQHYDKEMSESFFRELRIRRPDYNLNIRSGLHGEQTAAMLLAVEKVLIRERPQIVLVYGDTNSTLAGALAAAKLNIRVAHVEAGLRSYNNSMPEEVNRIITDKISSLFFCPTKIAVENLRKEGIRKGVHLVGDVMYDLLKIRIRAMKKPRRHGQYALCTIHRAKNTDTSGNLREIFKALKHIRKKVVLPLHPRTAKYLKRHRISVPANVELIKPVGYGEMLNLEKNAAVVITDSGGVQKEAFILGVPCVTMRNETEWLETVESGMNQVVGSRSRDIISAVKKALGHRVKTDPHIFYGDGFAHRRIADIIYKELKRRQ